MSRNKVAKQSYDPYKDVLSNLEDVSACITRAERSPRACVDGILKADTALEDTVMDPDLQCVALVKKAELLFIAHKRRYNLDGLPGNARLYSLDKCIADCDKVLNDSTGNSMDNPVYEKARELHYNAWILKEDLQREEKNLSSRYSQKRYDPSKTHFKTVEMINPALLQDIVDCYRKRRIVCRVCYFKKHSKESISASHHNVCRGPKKNPPKLLLIPASKMCNNLKGTNEVPILPVPKFLLTPGNRHKPFQICKNAEHQFCENKAAVGENRFSHCIEELVVWTIERHYNCTFTEYIERHHMSISRDRSSSTMSSPDIQDPEEVDTDELISDSYSEQEDNEHDDENFLYHPESSSIIFEGIANIPQDLLLSIVEKYRKMREYCKRCYYRSNEQGTASRDHQSDVYICSSCKYPWDPVKVIPSSELCWNFGDLEFLPIAPWPNGKPRKDPFEYCKKKDHFRCFRVYMESEFWYPHSVEEMVIWTVEREERKTFGEYIRNLGRHQTGRYDHPSVAMHAKPSISSSSLNQSHTLSHSGDSADHKAAKENTPANIEGGPLQHPRPVAISNKHKVLLENPHISGPGNIQGTQQEVPGPNQEMPRPYHGVAGPNQGTEVPGPGTASVSNQGVQGANIPRPPPNLSVTGQRIMMGHATVPGVVDMRQPVSAINNGGGPNPAQMPFHPYQHMYSPGGPRQMIFTSGMRPVLQYRTPLGGQPQSLSQATPQLYGMHPGNPYYNHYMLQASAAGPKPSVMGLEMRGGGYPTAPERNDERDLPAKETEGGNTPTLSSGGSGGIIMESKKSIGINNIDGEGSAVGNKTLISGGRKNYTVAPQSEEKRAGGGGVSKKKDVGGDDSGLGGEVGSISMNSDASGASLLMQVSSGAPRLATKVLEAAHKIFRLSEVNFKDVDDIPSTLIKSVALSFREKKWVCRMCFFGERDLSERDAGEMCSAGEHKWLKPIVVIPGCSQCDNEPSFQQGDHIPIFPLPPVAMLKKCPSTNHHKCFTKALDKQLFQAHSVEELVAWLVESESEASLETYARQLNVDSETEVTSPLSLVSPITSEPVSPLPQKLVAVAVSLPTPPPLPIGSLSPGGAFVSRTTPLGPIKAGKITDSSSVAVENVPPTAPLGSFSANPVGWNPMMPPPQRPLPPQVEQERQESKEPPAKPTRKYNPRDVEFAKVEDVPPHLLSSIAESFKQMRLVCRVCFFTSNCTLLMPKSEKKVNACKKDHSPFKPIRVITKSPLCMNRTTKISILPLPKHMKSSRSPFDMCKKGEHSVCYAMSRDTNPWFPHTVEELVVWIVERESAQSFESIFTKYIIPKSRSPVVTSGSKQTKAGGVVPSATTTTSIETTNYSKVVASNNSRAPSNKAAAESTTPEIIFSPDEDASHMAGNSQPFDDVPPLNRQVKTTLDSHISPATFYMHSQQFMAPPPGYGMPFYPSQPMPQMFRPSFPFQGVNMTTAAPEMLPPHPVVAGNGRQEPANPLMGSKPRPVGEFSGTWNDKSESSSGNMLRSAIWHDEDPLPESSTWSRVVGKKNKFQSMSPLHSLSQQSFESKEIDEIVHRSQVDEDSFQPYASIKAPSDIPAVAERDGARGPEPSKIVTSAKSPLHANEMFNSSRLSSSKGSEGRKMFDTLNQEPSVGNGNFLASAMAASVNAMGSPSDNLQLGGSPQEDIYHSRSNSPEDVVGPQVSYPTNLFRCLLCYQRFLTSDELKSHGSSDLSHLELCLLDSGHDVVWQYSPPPPQRSEEMKVCSVPKCVGGPQCSKPHSDEQLQEWRARLKHRQQRRRTGAHLLGQASPNLEDHNNCVPISRIPGFLVTVSEANSEPNNGYSWTIHIQGHNWLNLFGLTVKTTSQWTFKITHVEGAANSGVFHPHSSMWRAPPVHGHRVKQCLMLGSVQVTIKALPLGSANRNWRKQDEDEGRVSACIYLDLGYRQCFTVDLPSINNSGESVAGAASSGDKSAQQQHQALGLQMDQLKFSPSPSHDWTVDSDFSDELGDLNIEGEDLTLQHVPIEEWGCSLTDD